MSTIILLDTSVYLNVLDIPGRNQKREDVLEAFERSIEARDHLLLPVPAIWETGNHISRLSNGDLRYKHAQRFVGDVGRAINGETPYSPTWFPNGEELLLWLRSFPDSAKRNKSPDKTNEGISLADHAMIREWEQVRERHPLRRVRIRSLDTDLAGYDTGRR